MRFDYDPSKSRSNLERHGIDFADAQQLWDNPHVIVPARYVTDEDRDAILGKIRNAIYVAIFTERADTVRIISCHRADKRWERKYHEQFKKA